MKFTAITLASLLAASTSVLATENQPLDTQAATTPAVEVSVATAKTEATTPKTEEAVAEASDLFTKLDTDGDAKVSSQEAQVSPALVEIFAVVDADKDGFLTKEEFAKAEI